LAGAPSHDEQGHTWHHADRQLFDWILDRPPLATVMPAFRGTLSEEEVRDVIAFIKSEWPEAVRASQENYTRQYEQQLEEFGP
jgi:mono/diheme cytochrome c family protein